MSSTRNKNTLMNYNAEEKKNDRISNYKFNINSQYGRSKNFLGRFKLPESTQPTRQLNPDHLSYNPIDIESELRGINSTNLVNGSFSVKPDLKKIDNYKFYSRVPLILPSQITNDQNQRPLLS